MLTIRQLIKKRLELLNEEIKWQRTSMKNYVYYSEESLRQLTLAKAEKVKIKEELKILNTLEKQSKKKR